MVWRRLCALWCLLGQHLKLAILSSLLLYSHSSMIRQNVGCGQWVWSSLATRPRHLTSFLRQYCYFLRLKLNCHSYSAEANWHKMPKKVPFRVIYCTGWEDDYPPKDLEVRRTGTVSWSVASLACGAVLLPWFLYIFDFLPVIASLPIDICRFTVHS